MLDDRQRGTKGSEALPKNAESRIKHLATRVSEPIPQRAVSPRSALRPDLKGACPSATGAAGWRLRTMPTCASGRPDHVRAGSYAESKEPRIIVKVPAD